MNYKINHIAQLIGRHRSTVYRELKRCPANQYIAQDTQEVANQSARHKGRKPKHTTKLLEDIQGKLDRTWSPTQIIGRDYQGKRFFKSIYKWIY
ncbi:hypothetical protein FEZ33_09215 [Ruoffia tabacinasalis]|uniref:Uncharacterized protein n=1 Tax=Ruoffia tabacinasalis TaxID=87458 RepID=A0A5R9DYD0_9LACT|nr:helix-turn-helix domain-containing protein [Ruoffia tabacinasalis]TLQ40163.1 hypothetical protein FEZ33_09215 [Ruoffia tabacinasalis]